MTQNAEYVGQFADLNPPYRTIVADPPWHYAPGDMKNVGSFGRDFRHARFEYSTLSVDEISALPVVDICCPDSCLYLWTTNRYLRHAYGVAESWGFRPVSTLVWSKPPRGVGGGDFVPSAEFIVYAKRGRPPRRTRHLGTVFAWHRSATHSAKPEEFGDLVESVSHGPYVELFARSPRLGWDHWGAGYELSPSGRSGTP